MKKVFVFGYYGFKNLGDEATLSSIIKTIKKIDSTIEVSALSYNGKYTEEIHGVKGISRNNLVEVTKAIRRTDLVISGGGSLLQDVTSSRSLIYYLVLILLAKILKKPVLFYSNGFGPIRGRFNRLITRKVVNMVDKIIVRDKDSKDTMEAIGVFKHIDITTDATFVLESINREKAREILDNENIPMDKPLVGISIRPWYVKDSFIDTMASFADYLSDKGINVLFIPMQGSKDLEISNRILKAMKKEGFILRDEYRPEELLGVIGELEILIGMRLHALIFAGIMGIPMLGLEYDPKISSYLAMVQQKNMGKVEGLDHLNLCIEFDKLWTNRESQAQLLTAKVEEFKKKAALNKEILKRMLE